MNFDWNEYLYLAYELANYPNSNKAGEEARLRSSISRAYYACHCIARNYLRSKKITISHEHVHADVINCFNTKFPKNIIAHQIGNNLNRLKVNREKADYDDFVGNLKATHIFDLINASSIIELVKSLS